MDQYIPPQALADARAVLRTQDPDLAMAAEQRHPAGHWRAAIKQAAGEQHVVDFVGVRTSGDVSGRVLVGGGIVQGKQGELW